jgi:hypothetical protein
MSNYDYEDDDDFTTDDSSNDLVKQLRKAAKQKNYKSYVLSLKVLTKRNVKEQ